MNIHFEQVDRKSQTVSYLLVAFAIFLALLFVISRVRHVELHWSIPSVSIQTAQIEHSMPVAISAPLPPNEATNAISTPKPEGNTMLIAIPQVIPAPAPSMP